MIHARIIPGYKQRQLWWQVKGDGAEGSEGMDFCKVGNEMGYVTCWLFSECGEFITELWQKWLQQDQDPKFK